MHNSLVDHQKYSWQTDNQGRILVLLFAYDGVAPNQEVFFSQNRVAAAKGSFDILNFI